MKILGKRLPSRRAVSPVIATLLMIAVAVAASVIVYVWSIGLLGGLMGGGGSQVKQQVIMEAYNWSNSTSLTFTLRNVGSSSVTVSAVYLSGTLISSTSLSQVIAIGNTWTPAAFTGLSGYTAGAAYSLKVVSSTGGVFAFSVLSGRSG